MSTPEESCVFLLEDDQHITSAIGALCTQGHMTLHCFKSWEELSHKLSFRAPNCLIMSDSLSEAPNKISDITNTHQNLPVIILGQQHNLTSAVASIKAGAIDYIEKPAISGRLAEHIARLNN